jgi:hypothetical protein
LSKPPLHDHLRLTKFLTHAGEPLENGGGGLWLHLHSLQSRWQSNEEVQEDLVREERIHNEAIVDAYGPEERAPQVYEIISRNRRKLDLLLR